MGCLGEKIERDQIEINPHNFKIFKKKKKFHRHRLSDGFLCRFSDGFSGFPLLFRRLVWSSSLIRRLKVSLFRHLFWIAVAFPTPFWSPSLIRRFQVSLKRRLWRLFFKKKILPSKIFCRLSDTLHLSDGYLSVKSPTPSFRHLRKNQSVVHATGKCRKSDMTAVGFWVEM